MMIELTKFAEDVNVSVMFMTAFILKKYLFLEKQNEKVEKLIMIFWIAIFAFFCIPNVLEWILSKPGSTLQLNRIGDMIALVLLIICAGVSTILSYEKNKWSCLLAWIPIFAYTDMLSGFLYVVLNSIGNRALGAFINAIIFGIFNIFWIISRNRKFKWYVKLEEDIQQRYLSFWEKTAVWAMAFWLLLIDFFIDSQIIFTSMLSNLIFKTSMTIQVLVVLVLVYTMNKRTYYMERGIKLKNANEAKNMFLAQMSHEIRTPINAVLGMNELIIRETDDQEIIEYAKNIENSGSALLAIVNDILDFSKLESGRMDIIPIEYDVASLINDTYHMLNMRAENKGLYLKISNNVNLPSKMLGDEIRIRQVLINILTNAIKYTHKGGVTISADFVDEGNDNCILIISVADTGIGIKKESMDDLFVSFQRIDEKKNRNIEGTGLGLSITKQLVELMNGEILVSSKYGEGSTFTIKIPQKIIDNTGVGDLSENFKKKVVSKSEYKQLFTAPNAVILVVDDVLMNIKVFSGLLKKTKLQIHTANGGREALKLIKENKYDIIFMDHMMPELDGIETLQLLRKMEDNPNKSTPVIILTANAVNGAEDEYKEAGFDGYLSKPVKGALLEKMILEHLSEEKVENS